MTPKKKRNNPWSVGDALGLRGEPYGTRRKYKVPKGHACPECGEDDKFNIIHLRGTFKCCRTCGHEFIVSESLAKESKHEEENE